MYNNSALFGAGLTIYSIHSRKELTNDNNFLVTDSTFYENFAPMSSAVDIAPLNSLGDEGFLPNPRFINCTFENNSIRVEPKLGEIAHNNVGVFSVTQFRVVFGKHTTFRNNSYSAVLLESGIAEFECGSTVLFEKNTGFNGGAIAMYGFATIIFNVNTKIRFRQNHAKNYGGAIFYKTSDQHSFLRGFSECFIRNKISPEEESQLVTIEVSFEDNSAEAGGTAIYSTSFESCYIRCRNFFYEDAQHWDYNKCFTYSHVFKCVGNFTFVHHKNTDNTLLSSGKSFKFTHSGNETSSFSFRVFPGNSVTLPFSVTDDFHQKVRPALSIRKLNGRGEIDVADRYTLLNTITPVGKPDSTGNFTLTAVGVREIYFPFEITLLPCPPGYHIENDKCQCASGKPGYSEITKCNNSNFHAKYKGDFYVGYIPLDKNSYDYEDLYFAPCATPLCGTTNHHLPSDRSKLTSLICAEHRKGVMCGECEKGYATYYHSRNFTCGPENHCNLGALFYLISEIVPMVIFFIIVVTFDLSFTSGISVGFIFFTQYLSQLTIHINPTFSYLRAPYRFFYGLFNFEFFNLEKFSFCLWTHAQILDILVVKYITVVIAFGLVLAFIAVMQYNCCSRLCRWRQQVSAKTSVVNGLSAFLMICYAQCTRTSFYILRYTKPNGYNGKHIGYYSYYGGLRYFSGQHLVYAVPALISVVFVTILPPLVLLLYPLSLQLLSLCLVNKTLQLTGINKLKPFIDCFQSCYKDNLRFFAGLYFVYRVVVLLAFTVSANSLLFSVYSQTVVVLLLGIHATVLPYREHLHNTIDSLVFFNLALINGCAIISKVWIDLLEDPDTMKTNSYILLISAVQLLLLYMPMIMASIYLFRKGYTYFKHRGSDSARSAFEVDDILEHDSDHSTLFTSGTHNTATDREASTRKMDYGSTLDTY